MPLADALRRSPAKRPWTARFVDWVVEARSHRVICLVMGIWLFNAFDLILTILAHGQGLLHEENPVARQLLQSGPVSLSLYKIGLVMIGSYPLLKFRRARITELGTLVITVAYGLLAVHWSLCYEWYAVTATTGVEFSGVESLLGTQPE